MLVKPSGLRAQPESLCVSEVRGFYSDNEEPMKLLDPDLESNLNPSQPICPPLSPNPQPLSLTGSQYNQVDLEL